MVYRCLWLTTTLALAAGGAHVSAHHSIGRVYDSARQVTIEGVVNEFRFVNPHPFLIVDVEVDGGMESWHLEMDNRGELLGIGITAETFRPGERVVARGSAGRTQARTLYTLRLERPADGLVYEQRGFTPSITGGNGR